MRHLPRYLWLLLSLLSPWMLVGCGGGKATVLFQVKGVAPSADGSFTNQHDWTVVPSEVRLVLGDLHLKREPLHQNLQVFSSLSPLLEPGKDLPAEEIGHFGQFPGMWAVNIIYSAKPHTFPVGHVEVANWGQLQLRMSPAVSGVRGISVNDPLLQYTLLLAGQIRNKTAICNIRLRASIELGLAARIDFTTKDSLTHHNLIEVKYATWLHDVQFGQLCTSQTKNTLQIDNNSHPQIIEKIRNALPNSFSFRFSAGSAT